MMTIVFVGVTVAGVVLVMELVAATNAPFGYQDKAGFHFGKEPSRRRAKLKLRR